MKLRRSLLAAALTLPMGFSAFAQKAKEPTDGFFEYARRDGEFFGTPRIQDFIRAHRAKPSAAIAQGLYEFVIAFSDGGPQIDDMTIVIVKKL